MTTGVWMLVINLAAMSALIAHSWKFRGRGRTLVFFAAALAYGVFHEFAFHGNGYYFFTHKPVALGDIALAVPVFWTSMFYCAWWVGEYIVKPIPGKSDSLFSTVYAIGVVTLAVLLCVMPAAGYSGIIRWNWSRIKENFSFWMPITALVEGTLSSILFFIPYLLFTSTRLRRAKPWKIILGLVCYFAVVGITWIPMAGILIFVIWLLFSWRLERLRLDPEALADAYAGSGK